MYSMIRKRLTVLLIGVLTLTVIAGCQGTAGPKNNDTPAPITQNDNSNKPGSKSPNLADNKDHADASKLLGQIRDLAQEGKVPGCDYALKTTCIEDIEKAWGKPEKTDYVAAAKGSFASYPGRGLVFGFNKGSQIFDIRSYAKELNTIRQSDLVKIYGNPDMTRRVNGEDIIGYVMGDEFKIRFVFPAAGKTNPDPTLDHISVFYPRGTVNQMADDPGIEW